MKVESKITISFFAVGVLVAGLSWFFSGRGTAGMIFHFFIPLFTALLGYLSSKIISIPLRELTKGVRIISSGNLEYHVGQDTPDEVGQLSREFDKITDELRNARVDIDSLNRAGAKQEELIRELQAREEHFRLLFEQSNDAVFIYDIDGKIVDVNEKTCEMLGYTKDMLLNIPFLELQTEDELTMSKHATRTRGKTNALRFESKFVKSDGTVIDVGISSSCVDLKRGLMQAIVANITDRKRLERALRESEEKFRTFMETASDLMFITDREGNFNYVNEAMCNTLGYFKEEMIGMHITEIVSRANLAGFKNAHKKLLEKGEITYEPAWETKNRVDVYGEMKVTAIFDHEGEFAGTRGVFRDITERKKIEKSQRLAQLGKLAADVAHEVNNPVMIISGNAELALMEGVENKKHEQTFKVILSQCEQARSIVKRLLMFSKPSKGDFKKTNILDSIELVVSLLEGQFTRKKIKIVKKMEFQVPDVWIDEKQIQEVLMNLLRNSADAMSEGGTITIDVTMEGPNIRIDVIDTGTGISESDMKLMFDPFYTTKEHGTGLGLSVCYGIIKAHGGDLWYTSKVGKGTTASIVLPPANK
ncbi:MAG: PAS domain S-box protein [Candidatus Omnitrophica bacterium]|nr:PAS domain S-box protein [Candidatus Omnitrophota bacterium]